MESDEVPCRPPSDSELWRAGRAPGRDMSPPPPLAPRGRPTLQPLSPESGRRSGGERVPLAWSRVVDLPPAAHSWALWSDSCGIVGAAAKMNSSTTRCVFTIDSTWRPSKGENYTLRLGAHASQGMRMRAGDFSNVPPTSHGCSRLPRNAFYKLTLSARRPDCGPAATRRAHGARRRASLGVSS